MEYDGKKKKKKKKEDDLKKDDLKKNVYKIQLFRTLRDQGIFGWIMFPISL